MTPLIEAYEAVLGFFDAGGGVLKAIFVVTLLMWILISERLWYLRWGYKRDQDDALARWRARDDKTSWSAEQIRTRLISVMKHRLNHSLPMIATRDVATFAADGAIVPELLITVAPLVLVAIKLQDGDEVVAVRATSGDGELFLPVTDTNQALVLWTSTWSGGGAGAQAPPGPRPGRSSSTRRRRWPPREKDDPSSWCAATGRGPHCPGPRGETSRCPIQPRESGVRPHCLLPG